MPPRSPVETTDDQSDFALSFTFRPTSLHIAGSLDCASGPLLDEAAHLIDPVAAGDDVRVDLSAVDFIDASGIGALLRLTWSCRGRGHRVLITGASAKVTRTFDVAGVGAMLHAATEHPTSPTA